MVPEQDHRADMGGRTSFLSATLYAAGSCLSQHGIQGSDSCHLTFSHLEQGKLCGAEVLRCCGLVCALCSVLQEMVPWGMCRLAKLLGLLGFLG